MLGLCRQDDLEKRLRMKIRESPTLEKARALHARMTDSEPIDKVAALTLFAVFHLIPSSRAVTRLTISHTDYYSVT